MKFCRWAAGFIGIALGGSHLAFAAGQPNDDPAPLNGEALLVVYPDYPVNTDSFYGYTEAVGHAGVLLIDASGLTKYFEFGRYPPAGKIGMVRTVNVPNVTIGENGKATHSSLKAALQKLSVASGKGGRIRAAYFVNMNFAKMKAAAEANQPEYSITSFNCGQYAEKVVLAGNTNVDQPWIVNPVPRNIVDEYIEEKNAEVTLSASGDFFVGDSDESDAKE